jgi:hypothetical protein
MEPARSLRHHAPVRILTHITKLDDCFGDFTVRVICDCGFVREIEPEALARLVDHAKGGGAADALLAVWEEGGGDGGGREAQTAWSPEEPALPIYCSSGE